MPGLIKRTGFKALGALACVGLGVGIGLAWDRRAPLAHEAAPRGAEQTQQTAVAAAATSQPAADVAPGPVSVGFAQDMSLHHEQALVMADLASLQAGDAVRMLASGIRTAQQRELGLMQGWLMLWEAAPS